MGFRPSALEVVSEGVSECRGAALGGGVGRGLGPAWQEGGSEGRGLGFLVPKWTGKVLATFPSVPPRTPTNGLPHPHWTPNRGWVPLSVGTPPLPQPPLRGAGPIGLAFTFAPPSLPPAPSGPMAGGGLGGQRIRPGISAGSRVPKWAGENWPCSLLILCPLSGPTISPFGHRIPSPPPAAPRAPVPS